MSLRCEAQTEEQKENFGRHRKQRQCCIIIIFIFMGSAFYGKISNMV
jgi:hypothetical protein